MGVATCIETPTRFARRTVADNTGIAIGTILKLTDGNVAIISSGDTDAFAGIAWEEKTASDGITEITVAMNGRWNVTTTGANFTVGQIGNIGAENAVVLADAAAIIAGSTVGKSLTTISGAGDIIMEVGVIF